MTRLPISFPGQRDSDGNGAFQMLWTILCWASAFGAVVVTTAWVIR
jgi:hypothetical protein